MTITGTSTIRVRYEETDQGGIAHHSRHVVWFETARTEWLRELGMPYQKLEKDGIRFLVSEVTVNYQFPALYDDLLTVETTRGASQTISTAKYGVTGRGGKGRELLQRGKFTRVIRPPVSVPVLAS